MFVLESSLNDKPMMHRYDQISLRKTTIRPSTSQRQRAKRKPRILFSQVVILLVNIYNGFKIN
jgi:hypothetical protein